MERKDLDTVIAQYIEAQSSDNYDDIISQDERWEVFYHLSEMRKALFNWYDFEPGSSLLEIGGGFGALTGVFCQRCGQVVTIERDKLRADAIRRRYQERKNLHVICQDVSTWENTEKYDYIIMTGVLETICHGSRNEQDYINVLRRIKSWLRPKGKLLLAVENRFGIRYWCGAVDKHTGILYSGINCYPMGSTGITFDHEQTKHMLEEAGLVQIKFFYPLPDYTLPQLVYSDEYLPNSSVKERVIPYYLDKQHLMAYENDLYDDIVRNKAFEFMTNSFLVECSENAEKSSIVYAALTTDRGRENGFATIIRNDRTVEKLALYSEGKANIEIVYENITALERCGLHFVRHDLKNDRVVMPFVQENTACDDLRKVLKENVNEFAEILDQFYSCILQSSDRVSVTENRLPCPEEVQEELGVILQKAYIDMIPINCFRVDGELYFFDQEFVRECYPAKYVLYRMLKYVYFFIPEADQYLPLQILKEKYGLMQAWQYFEEEERRFVAANRNYDIYKHFRKWAAVNKGEIYKRNAGEKK